MALPPPTAQGVTLALAATLASERAGAPADAINPLGPEGVALLGKLAGAGSGLRQMQADALTPPPDGTLKALDSHARNILFLAQGCQ